MLMLIGTCLVFAAIFILTAICDGILKGIAGYVSSSHREEPARNRVVRLRD
jgi:hypothetical protein